MAVFRTDRAFGTGFNGMLFDNLRYCWCFGASCCPSRHWKRPQVNRQIQCQSGRRQLIKWRHVDEIDNLIKNINIWLTLLTINRMYSFPSASRSPLQLHVIMPVSCSPFSSLTKPTPFSSQCSAMYLNGFSSLYKMKLILHKKVTHSHF